MEKNQIQLERSSASYFHNSSTRKFFILSIDRLSEYFISKKNFAIEINVSTVALFNHDPIVYQNNLDETILAI